MRGILDTCTFIWLALDPTRLSQNAIEFIDDDSNELALSDASVMEIVMKYRVGKLPLPEAPHLWVPTRRDFFKLAPLALSEPTIFRSGRLPDVNKDSFDRLIAAHGVESGSVVISPYSPLSKLGASRIW
ncbi:MAG: hypothetical protein GVY36_12555 [Verrucomicrobia bacterium]|jgi:PIN domain nuclease of toxin-antitoxin system|nr:hypothetical protein [Verrucomicrobiota bacterium]